MSVTRRLLGALRPYLGRLGLAMLAMLVVAGTNGLLPVLIRPAIDEVFVKSRQELILPLALSFPLLFTIKLGASYLQGSIMGDIGQRVIFDLRRSMVARLLGMDQRFYHRRSTGELVSRITNDVLLVQEAVTGAFTSLFQHIVSALALIGVIFYLNWKLSLAAIIVFPIAVIPLGKFGRKIRKYARSGQENVGRLSSLLVEAVQGMRVLQLFGMEPREQERFDKEATHLRELNVRQVKVRALSSPTMEWIASWGMAAVIVMGGKLIADGEMTVGTLISYIAALMLVYDPIKRMNGMNQAIQQGIAGAQRIYELLDEQSQIVSTGDKTATFERGIELRDVHFRYKDEPVLRGVSLNIRKGETLAVVGSSGAGKSTLLDLLPRFLDVNEGQVLMDGVDVREVKLESLRSLFAMVEQRTILFNASVHENVRYGRPSATDAEVEAALRTANAAAFVAALPQKGDTNIGEDGVQLSGGQRQRLAIARAVLRDAPILILDEATSALDAESEQQVQQALERLMEGRTTIVVAHRLSTIRNAGRIAVLDRGAVAEIGSHDELIARGGAYAGLYKRQVEGKGEE